MCQTIGGFTVICPFFLLTIFCLLILRLHIMDFYSIFTIRSCSKSHQYQAATHIEEKSIEGSTLVEIQIFYNNVMKIGCCTSTLHFMARAYDFIYLFIFALAGNVLDKQRSYNRNITIGLQCEEPHQQTNKLKKHKLIETQSN